MKATGSAKGRGKTAYLGAIALLLGALTVFGVSLKAFNHSNTPEGFWYLDLDAGKFFLGSTKELPPIAAPSGGLGVRAHIYGCEEGCGRIDLENKTPQDLEKLGLFMSHLERISDEGLARAKQARANATGKMTPDTAAFMATMDDHLIMIMDRPDAKWVRPTIETTRVISEMLQGHCGGEQAEPCIPGRD